jgi:Dna[CI] antecedent DciA-like protein
LFREPQTKAVFSDATIISFAIASAFWSCAVNRASAGLETVIAAALRRAPASQSALLAWPVACGSAVADRTRALDFCDGILRVEVPDAGWRRELANLAPRYVASINKYSVAVVKRIEFVVKA